MSFLIILVRSTAHRFMSFAASVLHSKRSLDSPLAVVFYFGSAQRKCAAGFGALASAAVFWLVVVRVKMAAVVVDGQ